MADRRDQGTGRREGGHAVGVGRGKEGQDTSVPIADAAPAADEPGGEAAVAAHAAPGADAPAADPPEADTATTRPRRRNARSNRERILAAALVELARDPDVSMDDIARAAGVVRRTVYGHFPSRDALLEGLAGEAGRDLLDAVERTRRADDPPADALARMDLATWYAGDRYRLLIAFAQRNLEGGAIAELLAPVRARFAEIIEQGQREGVFSDHLPAPVLAVALESMGMGLLQAVNAGVEIPATEVTLGALLTLGVPRDRAVEVVARVAAED